MLIKGDNISVLDAINFSQYNEVLIKRRKNNLLLSNYHVAVLSRNSVFYNQYTNYKSLLFAIEDVLDDNFDEELDLVANQISDLAYYYEAKK